MKSLIKAYPISYTFLVFALVNICTPSDTHANKTRLSVITCNLSRSIIIIGQEFSLNGQITPAPSKEGVHVYVTLTSPSGKPVNKTAFTGETGYYTCNFDGTDITGQGVWTVKAIWTGEPGNLEGADSDIASIQVVETAGYAIIIQGKIFIGEGEESHKKTTAFVYQKLKQRGFQDDDIMYFSYDDQNRKTGKTPSKEEIKNSITQWALEKMNSKSGNLHIIMVGHGEKDLFNIFPDAITSQELSEWLDTLQHGLADQKITVLLGFSGSGSFIDDLSKENRVIIASTAPDERSFRGPEDIPRDGDYFVTEFFKGVSFGKSVRECFEDAVSRIESFTLSDFGTLGYPYYDRAIQHPLLDDNADRQGTNDLSRMNKEGLLINDLFIGVSPLPENIPGDVTVTGVADTLFLEETENTTNSIWAKVSDNTRVKTVWAEIKSPGYLPDISTNLSQAEMKLRKIEGTYSGEKYQWNSFEFPDSGTYQVFYFAKDNITGNVSPLMETKVYKAKHGNLPPEPVELLFPPDKAIMPTTLLLDWKETSDPDGDQITYTVFISKDDPTFQNPIQKQGLMISECLVMPGDGIEDFSTYYWKVRATDVYGSFDDTAEQVRVFYTDESTSTDMAYVKGYVTKAVDSQEKIKDAFVIFSATFGDLKIEIDTGTYNGYYRRRIRAGTYNIQATGSRYFTETVYNKNIPPNESENEAESIDFGLHLKGDIDEDGSVALDDVRKAFLFSKGGNPETEQQKRAANVYDDDDVILCSDVMGILHLSWGDNLPKKEDMALSCEKQ